jgi:hypothetical protein
MTVGPILEIFDETTSPEKWVLFCGNGREPRYQTKGESLMMPKKVVSFCVGRT